MNMDKIEYLGQEVERLKSAVEELSVLNKLALAVGASLNTDEVLNTIVREAVKAVKAEQGSIKLLTPTKERPLQTLIRQRSDDLSGLRDYRLDAEITGWVLKNKQALKIDDLANDRRFNISVKTKPDIHSLLCVPIWLQAKLLGILTVVNKRNRQSFTDGDLRLLSIIAVQSGQLIHNAQLQQQALEKEHLQHELELARRIQLNMLPKQNPQMAGLEIASYFSPARTVGGDYYDFIPFSPQQLLVVMADVSGHGPSAALVMTLLKGVIRSIAMDAAISSEMMRKINRIISRIIPTEIFITLQLVFFDLRKMRLFYGNAGHNPLLFYRAKEEFCHPLELHSCALNVLPDFAYPMQDYPIRSDDLIVVYTDGISEAMNPAGEMFGLERLRQFIHSSAKDSPAQMIQRLLDELKNFTDQAEQSDDRALVVVKIK